MAGTIARELKSIDTVIEGRSASSADNYCPLNDSPILKTSAVFIFMFYIFKNNKSKIMKKFFFATGILLVTVTTATYAQYNIDDINVKAVKSINTDNPNEIQKGGIEKNQQTVAVFTENQFANDFPHAANIQFEKTKDFDEVSFTQNGIGFTAYYDFNNQLVGTIHNGSFGDLPVSVQTNIVLQYPGYSVAKVLKFDVNYDNESFFDNNTYLTLYGTSFDTGSNYFVELKNGGKAIVLKVGLSGELSFFTTIK
jgi:hypothetical protein